ncbi:hypothetical protein [Vulcanisaeta sp. JCM 14467]|uniref:hypothetical protein n=1 Tax=Vulcanisaeta sp. JCM 14467 TaxID=1295370 RepID=UPI0006D048E2|nr:hypothetical protein [Vulcanisaeta sp. JCM 14467]
MDPRLREAYSRCVREIARGVLSDLVNGLYDYLLIDLASITYGLKDLRSFPANVRFAIDYGYLKPRSSSSLITQGPSAKPWSGLGLNGLGPARPHAH